VFVARRLPSQPPTLPGFSHIHILGSGGFADVFLYEQNMPRRQVAVKVMLSEVVNDQVRQMFQAEANLMAQLSAHPSILTVYQASVSSDGRPYLVMELCSSALSQRYRQERIETAHRAGVLHRDIKPSNILLTAYGHPVLSDFGIAATLSESGDREAVGMSIPWSAPEVLLDETAGSIESEVWAFAATVYSLLAGRSPFEVPGESNKSADLIGRIGKARPQPIDRGDVPPSLERALARAMSRNPKNRPESVIELVHELQAVETELGVPQTPVEVAMDEWALTTVADLEDRTNLRGAVAAVSSVAQRRRRRRGDADDASYTPLGTVRDSRQAPRSTGTRPQLRDRGIRAITWILVASAALVIALGITATVVLVRAGSTDIPTVSDISATIDNGTVTFSWGDPGITATDTYQISTGGLPAIQQRDSSFSVDANPGERVCIVVAVNRDGKTGSPSGAKCADVPA
jgi:hypothetical protein